MIALRDINFKFYRFFYIFIVLFIWNCKQNIPQVSKKVFIENTDENVGNLDSVVYSYSKINEKTIKIILDIFYKENNQQFSQTISYYLKSENDKIFRGQLINDTIFYQKFLEKQNKDTINFHFHYDNEELFLNLSGFSVLKSKDNNDLIKYQVFSNDTENTFTYTINKNLVAEEIGIGNKTLKLFREDPSHEQNEKDVERKNADE